MMQLDIRVDSQRIKNADTNVEMKIMFDIIMKKVGPEIEISDLENLERRIGVVLPEEYKEFLLKFNGGEPEPYYFNIPPINDESVVQEFFRVRGTKTSTLQYKIQIFEDRYPPDTLPIARDPGGNLILIGIENKNIGKIYFWDHELEAEDEDQPFYENVYLIANSLEEFLRSLHESSDENP